MIDGIVPIGGLGTRLGLPFAKEMLPQINLDFYKPVADNLVDKMISAGADSIYFIHGFEYKQDVIRYYNKSNHIHIIQKQSGFANTIKEYYDIRSKPAKILFGMPDTVFSHNPFIKMLETSGVVAGLFTTTDESKVDRLELATGKFRIKCAKSVEVSNKFWGVLKFDSKELDFLIANNYFSVYSEVGDLVNLFDFSVIDSKEYLDLGTWPNYNRYVKSW
jgi:hypothetical protein